MTNKTSERSRVIRILLDLLDAGFTKFTIKELRDAYNLTYFPSGYAHEIMERYDYDTPVALAKTYREFRSVFFTEGKKTTPHFHYYVKKFVKEGLVKHYRRKNAQGRAKVYSIEFTARTVAKLRLSERKGKSLKKRRRREPLDVEFRRHKIKRDENGALLRKADGSIDYDVIVIDPDELSLERLINEAPRSPYLGSEIKVFAGEKGDELEKVANLSIPYFVSSYMLRNVEGRRRDRPFRLTGEADNGREFNRFYADIDGVVKAVKYRKLKNQFRR